MDEYDLIVAAAARDEDAFADLVRLYEGRVRAWITEAGVEREEVKDVAQLVFAQAWTGLPGIRTVAAFPGWLRQIARRTSLSAIERRDPVQVLSPEGMKRLLDNKVVRDLLVERLAQRDELDQFRRSLPGEEQTIIDLRLNGVTMREMARILGCSFDHVRYLWDQVRWKLERWLRRRNRE